MRKETTNNTKFILLKRRNLKKIRERKRKKNWKKKLRRKMKKR